MYSKDSSIGNCACYCRLHHVFKHLKNSGLAQLSHGVLRLTTPMGQRLITHPKPYVQERTGTMVSRTARRSPAASGRRARTHAGCIAA